MLHMNCNLYKWATGTRYNRVSVNLLCFLFFFLFLMFEWVAGLRVGFFLFSLFSSLFVRRYAIIISQAWPWGIWLVNKAWMAVVYIPRMAVDGEP